MPSNFTSDARRLRLPALLASLCLFALAMQPALAAKPVTGNPAGDLDQCANGGVGSPPIQCAGSAWQNGNLNGNQAHYNEGDSVPYRLRMSGLTIGTDYHVTIEWDTTQSGKHALDYITSYNRTETTANPCSGVTGCSGSPNTIAILADPNVTGAGVTPVPGVFSLWGGTNLSRSGYTLSAPYTGSSATKITFNFTASVNNPVLAWGGHIATRIDWGQDNSAVSINGSPFHMRFLDLNGSGGNQDRSLSNDAVIFPAKIAIIKDTSPNSTTSFSFTPGSGLINGFPPANPPVAATAFTLFDDGSNVGNTKVLSTTTFGSNLTVSEADPAPAYAVTGACVEDKTADSSFSGRTATIKAQEGEVITCTFTNTLQSGSITLTKVVQSNNGGNAGVNDFGLTIGSTPVSSGGSIVATPGTAYAINETLLAGYQFVGITGDAACPSNLGGTVTVTGGQSVSCTITNRDLAPTLALTKTVSNTSGGNNPKSDWTLTATPATNTVGATTISGFADVSATPAKSNVVYTLSESSVTGYANGTSWTCTGTGVHQSGNTVSLDEGAAGSCNVTNTDQTPTLALTKTVSNTSGGNNVKGDWTLSATPPVASGAATISGSADVTATNARSNVVYTLSESSVAGYTNGTTWTCTGTGVHQSGNTVSLDEGAAGTCSITNTDQAPTLALDKTVASANGGNAVEDDFVLKADPTTGPDITDAGGDVPATAGTSNVTYTLSETSVTGYTGGSWSCSDGPGTDRFSLVGSVVTLDEGAVVTCAITNTDVAPTLALDKTVSNLSGGNAVENDFVLSATGTGSTITDAGGDVPATAAKSNLAYTLSETSVTGYTGGSWSCSDAPNPDRFSLVANVVTLDEGAVVTCAITNTDVAPTLALDKTINDQFGGGASEDDFVLTATPTSGSAITDAGGDVPATNATSNMAYTLTESSLDGYSGGSWSCSDTANPDRFSLVGNVVTLEEGAVVTCSITNSDSKKTPSGSTVQHWVLHDTLTITGIRPGGDPSNAATVTFRLYSDNSCDTQVGDDDTVGITAGVASTAVGVTVYDTGFYYWTAEYSGDDYNNGFTTGCGDEITQIQANDAKDGVRHDLL